MNEIMEGDNGHHIAILRKANIERLNRQIDRVMAKAELDTRKVTDEAEMMCHAIGLAAEKELRELKLKRQLEQCLLDFEQLKEYVTLDPDFLALPEDFELADIFEMKSKYKSHDLPIMTHQLLQRQQIASLESAHHWGFADFDIIGSESKWDELDDAPEKRKALDNILDYDSSDKGTQAVELNRTLPCAVTHRKKIKTGSSQRSRKTANTKIDEKSSSFQKASVPKRVKPSWEYVPIDSDAVSSNAIASWNSGVITGKRTRKVKSYEFE